ncbi:MmcQ/YjbR family DNA-binding protein [Flexithrix dorotheae]|uniref:MmcQ/YjbR family DNA-binding protein n=1 Tax=Flexithrix dorotheae TaxID=70993 RepID=UPI00036A6BD3|nr:MmcQ/YjbR family DNA-binding protein [Flexithrix dorotheae]
MNIEEYRDYCLNKPGVTEETPFDEITLVFKVMGKMFALTDITNFESINLKCDPEEAIALREKYDAVLPGYHMNKKHWNTIKTDGELSDNELKHWIDHSYDLVVSKLPKKLQEELTEL